MKRSFANIHIAAGPEAVAQTSSLRYRGFPIRWPKTSERAADWPRMLSGLEVGDTAGWKPALQAGFTIIELLVVIAIIAILAGLLLPAIARAKVHAQIKVAKMEMANLETAIKQYESEYSRMPGSKPVLDSANNNAACHDFTYGTPDIASFGSPAYKVNNSELIALLLTGNLTANPNLGLLSTNYNPRQNQFFHAKNSTSPNAPGIDPGGVFRDPWGNPYIITLDLNGDDLCIDGFYGYTRPKDTPPLDPAIRGSVLIWSLGPDGQADPNLKSKEGVNKDNVVSWE